MTLSKHLVCILITTHMIMLYIMVCHMCYNLKTITINKLYFTLIVSFILGCIVGMILKI